jgi:hypothetical protein
MKKKKKAGTYKPKQKNEIRLSSYLVKKKDELGKNIRD